MKIGQRLNVGLGVGLVLMVAMATFATLNLNKLDGYIKGIVNDRFVAVKLLSEITNDVNVQARAVRNMVIQPDQETFGREAKGITAAGEKIASNMGELQKLIRSDRGKGYLQSLVAAGTAYRERQAALIALTHQGKMHEASSELSGGFQEAQTAYLKVLEDLQDYQANEMEQSGAYAHELAGFASHAIWLVGLVALLVGGVLAWFLSRSITRPIRACVEAANQLAAGKTDIHLDVSAKDETGELQAAMTKMVEAINELVKDTDLLSRAAMDGKLTTRADAARHQGDFRRIVEGVNNTISRLVGLLDAMPTPAMVIDNDFTIQYINEMGAKAGGKTAAQLIGGKCHDHFKTSDCKTDKCACGQAIRGGLAASSETDAHPAAGVDLDIFYSAIPLHDEQGKVIGAFEVVSDQTAIKKAARLAQKITDFQDAETEKVVTCLKKLSEGDTSCTITPAEGDADTEEVCKTFQAIADSFNAWPLPIPLMPALKRLMPWWPMSICSPGLRWKAS